MRLRTAATSSAVLGNEMLSAQPALRDSSLRYSWYSSPMGRIKSLSMRRSFRRFLWFPVSLYRPALEKSFEILTDCLHILSFHCILKEKRAFLAR